jgi:hypothetical protein
VQASLARPRLGSIHPISQCQARNKVPGREQPASRPSVRRIISAPRHGAGVMDAGHCICQARGHHEAALLATPRLRRAIFVDLSKHSRLPDWGILEIMAAKAKMLSYEEFASLLTVGNTCAVVEPPAVIPAEHSA